MPRELHATVLRELVALLPPAVLSEAMPKAIARTYSARRETLLAAYLQGPTLEGYRELQRNQLLSGANGELELLRVRCAVLARNPRMGLKLELQASLDACTLDETGAGLKADSAKGALSLFFHFADQIKKS